MHLFILTPCILKIPTLSRNLNVWSREKKKLLCKISPSILTSLQTNGGLEKAEIQDDTHTLAHREPQSVPPFAITPTKRLSSLLSHTQAGSQRKPMDQFSTEKLWHSSNVMGFDVDAELHYRTPMKPVKPLFICLLPMQKTLAGNMPHFSYAASFFFFILCKEECGSWHAHLHFYALSPLHFL